MQVNIIGQFFYFTKLKCKHSVKSCQSYNFESIILVCFMVKILKVIFLPVINLIDE